MVPASVASAIRIHIVAARSAAGIVAGTAAVGTAVADMVVADRAAFEVVVGVVAVGS